MTSHKGRCFLIGIVLLWVTACSTPDFQQLLASADAIAFQADFKRQSLSAGQFTLVTYQKIRADKKSLTVYIEGDGKSYITRTRVSLNPTPHNPLGLQLAAADTTSENIVYLGRPCQFVPTHSDPGCDPKYWTRYSYSQTVVSSLNHAIDQLKTAHQFSDINLVGFSGGGALAVLVASQRRDVTAIRTVAGNLDIVAFTDFHNVSTMSGSLNPAEQSAKVNNIPQRHFIGAKDKVVPQSIAESYRSRFANISCLDLRVIDEADHLSGWLEQWSSLYADPVNCH